MKLKIPLVLALQPEGGYSVTSPILPELHTEGDSADEAVSHVEDALAAVIELYEDLGRPLPHAHARADYDLSRQEPGWRRSGGMRRAAEWGS